MLQYISGHENEIFLTWAAEKTFTQCFLNNTGDWGFLPGNKRSVSRRRTRFISLSSRNAIPFHRATLVSWFFVCSNVTASLAKPTSLQDRPSPSILRAPVETASTIRGRSCWHSLLLHVLCRCVRSSCSKTLVRPYPSAYRLTVLAGASCNHSHCSKATASAWYSAVR